MSVKNKKVVETKKVHLDVLDSIGCACGSCDTDHQEEKANKVELKVAKRAEVANVKVMVKETKPFTLDILDNIGCGCGCDDSKDSSKDSHHGHNHADHGHGHKSHNHGNHGHVYESINKSSHLQVLDTVGCACGSASCSDGAMAVPLVEEQEKSSNKVVNFVKENWQLGLSFIIFFYGIFSSHGDSVDIWIYLAAYVLIARDVVLNAVKGVFKGRMLDENFLMTIASIVAFMIGEYPEGVAVMLFYRVGEKTEHYALNRSKTSISALLDIRSEYANLKDAFGIRPVSPESVKVDDIVVVKVGEKIPLDGEVVSGASTLDTSAITGESLPANVEKGTKVFSGTINLSSVIEVRVTKDYSHSTVSKIMELVAKTNENKAETEKFITKFAKVYTPMVVGAAVLLAVLPPLMFAEPLMKWAYRAAIFLVVSCPCALVISVPLGYFGGIGGAARAGVLVKGGNFLEALKDVGTVVFDKTGTLTKGNFKVKEIKTYNGSTEEELLRISAHLESYSNHPIAKAIVEEYNGAIDQNAIANIEEVPGKGIIGSYQKRRILIGNEAMLQLDKIEVPSHEENGTTLFIAEDKKLLGVITIMDEIKDGAAEGIQQLKDQGVENIYMLTGDREKIANHIGGKLGIKNIFSQLLPHEKVEKLEIILKKHSKKKVLFVGDGINDAPVLARADVGVAMGALGSDVAIEAADVVLMTDEISKVAEAIKVSKYTGNIIWQNIILALGVKVIIMILGAVGIANMWTAVFGDVGVAFLAILNSGRVIAGVKGKA